MPPTAIESYMCHQIRTAEHPLTLPFIQVEQQNQELATKLTHLSQLMLGAPLPMGESACAREVVAKTAKKPCRRVTFGHYGERAQTNRRASAVTGLSSGGSGVSRPFFRKRGSIFKSLYLHALTDSKQAHSLMHHFKKGIRASKECVRLTGRSAVLH